LYNITIACLEARSPVENSSYLVVVVEPNAAPVFNNFQGTTLYRSSVMESCSLYWISLTRVSPKRECCFLCNKVFDYYIFKNCWCGKVYILPYSKDFKGFNSTYTKTRYKFKLENMFQTLPNVLNLHIINFIFSIAASLVVSTTVSTDAVLYSANVTDDNPVTLSVSCVPSPGPFVVNYSKLWYKSKHMYNVFFHYSN